MQKSYDFGRFVTVTNLLSRKANVLSHVSQADSKVQMLCLGESLHHGPIAGLALCAWKTIFMTCGEIDRTVRVWDSTNDSLILTKHYQEDIFCVALHPTGVCGHARLGDVEVYFKCGRVEKYMVIAFKYQTVSNLLQIWKIN